MTDVVLILTTVATAEQGETVARTLVGEGLAACVNVLAPMTSVYRWKGAIERDTECQVVIKSTVDRVALVKRRLKELHTYDLPELLVVPVAEGGDAYLEWVRASTRPVQ